MEVNRTTWDVSGQSILTGILYTFAYEGIFNWFYRIFDIAGNRYDTQNNTLTIDATNPLISFESQTENSGLNFSRNWIYMNVSVTETNEANITFSLYNITNLVSKYFYENEIRLKNFTGLKSGKYYYNVTVFDLAGNSNYTETREIGIDNLGPTITIVEPEDKAVYGYNTSLPLNVTVFDNYIGIDSCWWNIDGLVNYSITCNTNTTFNASEGGHTITFYSNDTLGNLNSENSTFGISTLGPAINLHNPKNNKYIDYTSNIVFNYTPSDPDGVDTCILYGNWNGGWHANQTDNVIENVSFNYFNVNIGEGDGHYLWNVWCNDSNGLESWAVKNYTLTIDLTNPLIEYSSEIIVDDTEDSFSYSGIPTNPYNAVDEDFGTFGVLHSDPEFELGGAAKPFITSRS